MTPEQERAIKRMSAFLEALTEELGKLDEDDARDSDDEKASAVGAAKRVARTVIVAEAADGAGPRI